MPSAAALAAATLMAASVMTVVPVSSADAGPGAKARVGQKAVAHSVSTVRRVRRSNAAARAVGRLRDQQSAPAVDRKPPPPDNFFYSHAYTMN